MNRENSKHKRLLDKAFATKSYQAKSKAITPTIGEGRDFLITPHLRTITATYNSRQASIPILFSIRKSFFFRYTFFRCIMQTEQVVVSVIKRKRIRS